MNNTFKTKLFLLIVALLFTTTGAYAQLTINVQNSTVKHVVKEIETKSNYRFFYSNDLPDLEKKVTIKVTNQPVEKVLNQLFHETNIAYIINEKQIALTEKSISVSSAQDNTQSKLGVSKQPEKIVTGRVLDSNSEPLIGVNIREIGTSNGAVTDSNGNYRILISNSNGQLSFSYVGFSDKIVNISNQNSINVSMEDSESVLDEIVVIGYGTQRKVDITGSITSVNTDDLQKVVVGNAGQALQGLAAGVNVRNYGLPGGNQKISIRGVTSFGDINPLIIVDGIEQSLNHISTDDIESIQVLKDARVAAIYGVRGSNGVILVTTKKGKSGKPKVTYSGNGGITLPLKANAFNLLNSEEYMHVVNIGQPGNELFVNGMPDYLYSSPVLSGVAFEGDAYVDPARYFFENPNKNRNYLIQKVNKEGTDWFREAFKKANFQEHNLSVTGGGDHARYYFSVGFLDQNGTLVETFLKRISTRINTEFNVGKYIKVGENLNIFYNSFLPFTTGVSYGGIAAIYKLPPIIPLKDIMGNWGGTWIGPELGAEENMVANLHRNAAKSNYASYNIVGNVFAEANILKYFTLRTSFGLNYRNNRNQIFSSAEAENAERNTQPNSLELSVNSGRTLTFSNTLSFKKTFWDSHNVDFLIGSEAIENRGDNLTASTKDFDIISDNYLLLQLGQERLLPTSSLSKSTLLSFFSRADYNFDDRYLLGVTVRRDGSSLFGTGSRWGTFPSFSLGWRVSQEQFMQNTDWLNDLKLRASYGILGSQNNVSASNQFSTYAASIYTTAYDIAGTSNSVVVGMARNRIGNYYTGWEKDIIQNLGLDVVIFDNKLDFQLDLYKKSISGLLLSEPLPSVITALVTSPTINIGDIQNKGIDFIARYRFNFSDFKNSFSANLSKYKNTIIKLPDPGYFGGSSRNEVGHPTGMFYGYKIVSIFKDQNEIDVAAEQDGAQPGRFRYEDINKDDKITPDDRQYLGSPHPDFTYGFILSSEYKGFDLSAQFYGVYGNKIYNSTRISTDFFQDNVSGNKSRRILNAWTPDNLYTSVPKIENARSFSTIDVFNDYALEDGSYLRLKTLSLGYAVNPKFGIMQQMSLSNLRIALTVSNLFTLTKYSGLDPDIAAGSPASFGIDVATYPTNEKRFTIGISATF